MTLEQELEIQELLKQWREERHLTLEMQNAGLMGNLCEELSEYYRATNNDEKIDALCDMYVFCMNSLDGDLNFIKDVLKTSVEYRFPLLNYINTCLELINSNKIDGNCPVEKELNKYLQVLMLNVEIEATEMGYDFYKCMLETIKEISSRTGNYDKNIHKFVKDTTPEAVKNWHKADYSKCRITDR